jgi:hypothetical protein
MRALDPHATTALLLLAATWTMVFAGVRKQRLELRHGRRRCPSCGRAIDGRVCRRH